MDVRIEDLRFERDGRVVLNIPALRLQAARTTVILGPNGAGKTTLLRLIAALEHPSAGRILANERPIDSSIHWRRRVAVVFQEHVFLQQTVRANLELGLELRGVRQPERSRRVSEAAGQLGISHLLDRRADRLSGGEGRRASLARALCLRSPLVLLDEPLAGLDAATYRRLMDDLPGLLEAFGATTILVTHDRDEALRLGQDLVVLIEGRVAAAGGKHDVLLHPAGAAVAEILGYTVVVADGRSVAVPADALAIGPGPLDFEMVVDDVLDLVDHYDVVGRIGVTRVHVAARAGSAPPQRGDRIVVHAARGGIIPLEESIRLN
jgi:tungstate transport system ATP-binding protein